MAKLLLAKNVINDTGELAGLVVSYRIGGDIRQLFLSSADLDGLSTEQIRTLAQSLADADTGLDGSNLNRTDILPDAIRQARQWFRDGPARINFLLQTPDEIDAAIDSMTLAQVKEVVKGAVIIARAYGLTEIAD